MRELMLAAVAGQLDGHFRGSSGLVAIPQLQPKLRDRLNPLDAPLPFRKSLQKAPSPFQVRGSLRLVVALNLVLSQEEIEVHEEVAGIRVCLFVVLGKKLC